MLVSHSHRFIYLKGYKVGGTSTEVYFQPACQPDGRPVTHGAEEYVGPEGIVGYRGPDLGPGLAPTYLNHMSAAQLRAALAPEVWSGYFKFANVRNPFSAVLSGVLQAHRARGDDLPASDADLIAGLDATLAKGTFNDGATFVDGAVAVDDVIRFEDLAAETRRIAARLGFDAAAPVPHLKKSASVLSGRHPAEFFTPARAARLVDRAGPYFQAFGYSIDPADAPPFPASPAVRKKDQLT